METQPIVIRGALCAVTMAALLAVASAARAGEVNASLSSREAYVGAPITLRLEVANAASHDEPVLPHVAGLDIESVGAPSRSTRTTIINARRTDRTSAIYAWRIIPRRAGEFVIPGFAIQVDGLVKKTPPLRFVASKSETGDLLFVEAIGGAEKIYVGQPVALTLNIWIRPYRDAEHQLTVSEADTWRMISDATRWGPFAERLAELAENNQRPGGEELLRKDGAGAEHSYYRYQVEAEIYPKRPGRIDLDDLQVVVEYPTRLTESRDPFGAMFDSDFFGSSPFGNRGGFPFDRKTLSVASSRPLVAQATIDSIEVLPIPSAGRPSDYRGAVGEYQVATHATPTSVKAGEPITLHVGISGDGPMELVQAPPLAELPMFAADFKVGNEPLAGIVQGEAKLFTTTIRPRRASIAQIPAIPFSYFDPKTEKFVTVYSDPIEIHVDQADRLSLDSIVGAARGAGDRTAADEPAQLNLTNYSGVETIAPESSDRSWLPSAALWFPPLLFVFLLSFRQRGSIVAWLRGAARNALGNARQGISRATSAADISNAITGYAARRLRRRTASLTRCEIASELRTRGWSTAAQPIDDILARCELAKFAGLDEGRLGELKSAAHAALAELASAEDLAATRRPARPRRARRFVATACLLLAVVALALPAATLMMKYRAGAKDDAASQATQVGSASSDEISPSLNRFQRETLLAEANAAYQRGVRAADADAATANEAFSQSAAKYQLLLDDGVQNSRLYCNLGNAYLQSGSPGRAIANYRRALRIDPANDKAQANLAAARRGMVSASTDFAAGPSLSGGLVEWSRRLTSLATSAWLFAVAWGLLWAAVLAYACSANRRWRFAWISAACLVVVCLAAGLANRPAPERPQAIVAMPEAVLRAAPGDDFPAVTGEPLPEGESLTVLGERSSWLQVQTPAGQTGWVAAPQIERVAPL